MAWERRVTTTVCQRGNRMAHYASLLVKTLHPNRSLPTSTNPRQRQGGTATDQLRPIGLNARSPPSGETDRKLELSSGYMLQFMTRKIVHEILIYNVMLPSPHDTAVGQTK